METKTTGKNWKALKGAKIIDVKILDNRLDDEECLAFLILDNGLALELSNAQYYPSIKISDKEELAEWDDALKNK